jgi:hypothetical protein
MGEADVSEAIELLLMAYPNYKPSNPDGLVDLWIRKFGKVDREVLLLAVDMHIDQSKYFPGPSEIKALLPAAQYKAENKRTELNLYPMRAWAVELENRYYREGRFDREEWEKLIEKYRSLGHEACAETTRKKMEAMVVICKEC